MNICTCCRQATQQLRLVLIPQVVAEFGRHPHEMDLVPSTAQGTTDETLLHTAIELHLPLFSEDGRLLRRAQALHHPHYNTLMLLLALFAQGRIAPADYDRLRSDLLRVARYARAVVALGQALHQALISSMDGQKAQVAAVLFAAHHPGQGAGGIEVGIDIAAGGQTQPTGDNAAYLEAEPAQIPGYSAPPPSL